MKNKKKILLSLKQNTLGNVFKMTHSKAVHQLQTVYLKVISKGPQKRMQSVCLMVSFVY